MGREIMIRIRIKVYWRTACLYVTARRQGMSALRFAPCESQFHIRSHPVYPVYPCSILSPSLPLCAFPVTP